MRSFAEPITGDVDGALRDVEYAEAAVFSVEQIVNQCRFAAAHVDDASVAAAGCGRNEFQGLLKMWPIPAYLRWLLGPIDAIPMRPYIHAIHPLRFAAWGTTYCSSIAVLWHGFSKLESKSVLLPLTFACVADRLTT